MSNTLGYSVVDRDDIYIAPTSKSADLTIKNNLENVGVRVGFAAGERIPSTLLALGFKESVIHITRQGNEKGFVTLKKLGTEGAPSPQGFDIGDLGDVMAMINRNAPPPKFHTDPAELREKLVQLGIQEKEGGRNKGE